MSLVHIVDFGLSTFAGSDLHVYATAGAARKQLREFGFARDTKDALETWRKGDEMAFVMPRTVRT